MSQRGNNTDKENTPQKKDLENNLLATGMTIMLGFFSGSVSNLSVETIKEFGGFLELLEQKKMKRLDLPAIGDIKKIIFNGAGS